MAEEKLLTIRDVAIILGVSEKEVIDLAETGSIPAYKIGGIYLRFKRQQVDDFRKRKNAALSLKNNAPTKEYSLKEKVDYFFYFNDFYILSAVLILLIALVILRGY
jgi:excisionase family DNA binding protein